MKNIRFSDVTITGGFWKTRQDINRQTTLRAVYERFRETGRFEALRCGWKEGDPNPPHVFWDSDVAKWMEGAAYCLRTQPDEGIAAILEETIDCILQHQDENGYFNSHFLVMEQDKRFRDRNCHELYCAGHWFEAAVAYYEMTGKERFLRAMCRYADYIERVFRQEHSAGFITPGHPEIELALMRLYRATGEKRYAALAQYFIDQHGQHPAQDRMGQDWIKEPFNQDEVPLRERTTAEGHAVRALYLLCGAADVAEEYGDTALEQTCRRLFENVVGQRMYITGGVGSTYLGEAFTVDYDLPNRTAYAETCASIAMAMFAGRMQRFGADSRYGDIVETVLYNGILSGVSMDGKSFFYENPLAVDPAFNHVNTSTTMEERFPITQRLEVFECSCCPPNILRFVASVGGYAYGMDDDTVYVHQYMDSVLDTDGIRLTQRTVYPQNGTVSVQYQGEKRRLAFRIPGWCRRFTLDRAYTLENGYAYVPVEGDAAVTLELDMPVRLVAANPRVHADAGRVAVMRGPVVYCAEGVDNGADLAAVAVDIQGQFRLLDSEWLLPRLETTAFRPQPTANLYPDAAAVAYEPFPLTLIPYYAFANRGETEMQVWLLRGRPVYSG